MKTWRALAFFGLTAYGLAASSAFAASCGNDAAGFGSWVGEMRREAQGAGIGARGLAALETVSYDPQVVSRDRRQGVFRQSFEQFSGRMVPPRLARGRAMMQRHGALLKRLEQQYGVPGGVIVAIWGLETDFGADNGRFDTLNALATLAYDCRRPEKFRPELLDALRIIARGDYAPSQMRGAWAGEIGQTQFMPSSYLKFAVDFDGDGRRDPIRSTPDALASTANYLRGYGWQRGAAWSPGSKNFDVLLQWNKSQVYSQTIAYFARVLEGTE